eukprot:TRINITY_DN2805_c0_g3_i3.p1 TRINITY_DN2805_c0_g3~~TRINITY_DN2805_c0_g3_i3.p1  ORF type:complete len:502 (+),score=134.24 TRINITY_DN2805_c0_g3_i3:53-1558(+)
MFVALVVAAVLLPQAGSALHVGKQIGKTDPLYASWNFDSSCNRGFHHTDFKNANLRAAAKGLAPSRLRFGGSGNDYLHYQLGSGDECKGIVPPPPPHGQDACAFFTPGCLNASHWDDLYGLSVAAGAEFLFGVSFDLAAADKAGAAYKWNSANAMSLVEYAAAHNQTLWGFELGNEVNNNIHAGNPEIKPAMQAEAIVLLARLARKYFPDAKFVGPDTGYWDSASYLTGYFAGEVKNVLHAATNHVYNGFDKTNFNDPEQLDSELGQMAQFTELVRRASPTLELWAGEMGPAAGGNDGSCSGHPCGTFASAMWYADDMGLRAAHGYTQYQRQDLFGARYGLTQSVSGLSILGSDDAVVLTADYWVNFLWKRMIGSNVLNVTSPSVDVREYGFSGPPPSPHAVEACRSATQLVLVNLDLVADVTVQLAGAAGAHYTAFSLTPLSVNPTTSGGASLNGKQLPTLVDVTAGAPTFLEDVPGDAVTGLVQNGLTVPASGVTFVCY